MSIVQPDGLAGRVMCSILANCIRFCCMQCPGAGEYNVRFTGNCAVPFFADGRSGAPNCESSTIVEMGVCDSCHVVERVEFDVEFDELTLPTISIPDSAALPTRDMSAASGISPSNGARVDEQELQAQMAQMFQHQTLPVLAFPTQISQPLDAAPGSREFLRPVWSLHQVSACSSECCLFATNIH